MVEARQPGCVPNSEKQSWKAAEKGCHWRQTLPAQQGPPAGLVLVCPGGGEGAKGYSRCYCTQSCRAGSEFLANSNVFRAD